MSYLLIWETLPIEKSLNQNSHGHNYISGIMVCCQSTQFNLMGVVYDGTQYSSFHKQG